MKPKSISTKQYLAVVEKAKASIAKLPDNAGLSPQRVADDVIASCGGDLSKVEAAFETHGKQTASTKKPSLVESILSKRHARR